MITHILIPVDGSKQSDKALHFACSIADKYEARLHVQHTVEVTLNEHAMFLGSSGFAIEASDEEIQAAGNNVIESAMKIIDEYGCQLVETEIVHGSAAQNILQREKASDIDMIIMGSRGLSDLSGLLLGSVSHKVSHLAQCTCVTVR